MESLLYSLKQALFLGLVHLHYHVTYQLIFTLITCDLSDQTHINHVIYQPKFTLIV